jgi:hypothetical protein
MLFSTRGMGSSLVLSRHHRSEIRLAGLAEASRRCGAARSQAQFTNTFSAADGNSRRPPPVLARVAHAPFASKAYVGNATNQKIYDFYIYYSNERHRFSTSIWRMVMLLGS